MEDDWVTEAWPLSMSSDSTRAVPSGNTAAAADDEGDDINDADDDAVLGADGKDDEGGATGCAYIGCENEDEEVEEGSVAVPTEDDDDATLASDDDGRWDMSSFSLSTRMSSALSFKPLDDTAVNEDVVVGGRDGRNFVRDVVWS